jgi:hypothetical protein
VIARFDYASPSALLADDRQQQLGLCGDGRRPVRFRAVVVPQHAFLLRVALRALGGVIWSDDTWVADGALLDPVITVHPDRLFLEAFSQDQSACAQLILDPALFRGDGPVVPGTTNVDFTAWLWAALGEMRSSRETVFAIAPEGFAVATAGGGGRFEARVELPDSWVRGFLQVQAAMAMPGTRLRVRPVDLLSAIRFLRYTKAKVSPRGLRYEFEPGADARLVLEPWEHCVPLRGAGHAYAEPRTIRLWGRRRLSLLEPLLPFAEHVDVHLRGRALPSFYAVHLPRMTFVLGVTGSSGHSWTGAGFDLLQEQRPVDAAKAGKALELLQQRHRLAVDELAQALAVPPLDAAALLQQQCRLGRAVYDLERREYRHRELFAQPIDEAKYYPPDERVEAARAHLQRGEVSVDHCAPRETRKRKWLKSPEGRQLREVIHRDWQVLGRVGPEAAVEIVIGERGSVIFGRCGCAFFETHLLARGPCQHMLALFESSAPQRVDAPTSRPAEPPPVEPDDDADDGEGSDDGDGSVDADDEEGNDAAR